MTDLLRPEARYRAIKLLSHPQTRTKTYLAIDNHTYSQVVIKYWPELANFWGYAYQQRFQRFANLNHAGVIPFRAFFTHQGALCAVREYIDADSLATRVTFQPEEIQAIAISLLQVLVHLQHQLPPVFHGNLKPENIFLKTSPQGHIQVVLADFDVWLASANLPATFRTQLATPVGFVPPEQLWRQPTRASDLYAVGATLVSLLTGTSTACMDTLTSDDDPYQYRVREPLLQIEPNLTLGFLTWLERLLAPNVSERFVDALTALQTLQTLKVVARPRLSMMKSVLHLQARSLGETVSGNLRLDNLMPDTVLQGQWRVTPRADDPCQWIQISPTYVAGNATTVTVTAATQDLLADMTYIRELIFESNSESPSVSVTLCVKTAPLASLSRSLPASHLLGLLVLSGFLPIMLAISIAVVGP